MNSLKGQRILISGGTLGIGYAIAETLLGSGARGVVFSRDLKRVENALKKLEKVGEVYGIAGDVSNIGDVTSVFHYVDETLGGLDVLINNAGLPADGIGEDLNNISYILQVNLDGYIYCAKLAEERFKNGGYIINIGSLSAQTKDAKGEVYVASKSGVEGFSDSLRRSLFKKGVKVTLIEPGAVATGLHGLPMNEAMELADSNEMLKANDIAEIVFFCLSLDDRINIINIRVKPSRQDI